MRKFNPDLKVIATFFCCFFLISSGIAQSIVKGTVSGADRQPLSGASVVIQGASKGTTTDESGNYALSVSPGRQTIIASYVGLGAVQMVFTAPASGTVIQNFVLQEGINLNEVVVLGSRSLPRTQLETTVPVDVIDIKKISQDAPQVYINQILSYVAPSFNSGTQTVADGTDHIDPASLRGLGPDQVLVLINGKRRHNTALVNINGTFGRGSTGTDLNSIPVSSIDRIEILRDGASAQYGSDAIAGVINIILKSSVNTITASTTGGQNMTRFMGKSVTDGETVQTALNFGIPMGQKGGFINLSGSFDYRNFTQRAGDRTGAIYTRYNGRNQAGAVQTVDRTDSFLTANRLGRGDFKQRVGQSLLRSGQFMFNAGYPMDDNGTEFYLFGGIGYRNGQAAGNRRLPNESRNVIEVYPLGFLPEIHSDIYDKSIAAGIRGKLKDWNVDFSNNFGQNQFNFRVVNSLNSSLLTASPTRFNAGGPIFSQNTTNLDFSKRFEELKGINVAFGAEHRFERYQLIQGDPASYIDYGKARQVGVGGNGQPIIVADPSGPMNTRFGGADSSSRAGGAQVFNGFRPENAVNATRSAIGAYVDGEFNFSEAFLLNAAIRFENYNDFGSTINEKISMRYKLKPNVALRASASTGFRAPSLHQRFLATTSTVFINGIAYEQGTFANDSRPAELLGIPKLRAEKSKSVSAGFTGTFGKFKVTLDGYFTRINDRIVYTDQFAGNSSPTASPTDQEIFRLLSLANAGTATFFANAINTETKGLDAVISHGVKLGRGTFRTDLSATYSKTNKVGPIMASDKLRGKENVYFSEASRIYLESAVPRTKVNLTFTYNVNKFNFFLRNVYFGAVDEATATVANQQTFPGKVITDFAVGYKISKGFKATVGANNLLDVYPDAYTNPANTGGNQFIYSRRVTQFGYNGRYIFGRLELTL